jgi:hypothetical protein
MQLRAATYVVNSHLDSIRIQSFACCNAGVFAKAVLMQVSYPSPHLARIPELGAGPVASMRGVKR